jgi:hypothetical protein
MFALSLLLHRQLVKPRFHLLLARHLLQLHQQPKLPHHQLIMSLVQRQNQPRQRQHHLTQLQRQNQPQRRQHHLTKLQLHLPAPAPAPLQSQATGTNGP